MGLHSIDACSTFDVTMCASQNLLCDGCGQPAPPEHLAARFRRLEWATRYRPLHISTLILCAMAPERDAEFIYSNSAAFHGPAAALFRVAGITTAGKSAETLHHEIQRTGIFAAYVLDCPQPLSSAGALGGLLASRLPFTLKRIRTSLKPKRVLLASPDLNPLLDKIVPATTGCSVVLDGFQAFKLEDTDESTERIRRALATAAEAAT
jgi:hypothetical protein